jgi:hypothetical protein
LLLKTEMSEKEPLQYVTDTANNVFRRMAHFHTRGAAEQNQDQTGMVMVHGLIYATASCYFTELTISNYSVMNDNRMSSSFKVVIGTCQLWVVTLLCYTATQSASVRDRTRPAG